jgi:tRNA dimethylallyltransferase
MTDQRLVFISGPTASGKSDAAAVAAQLLPAEVVSVDSMNVYRHMDIGTAKPSAEMRALVPHHLIDVVDPSDDFSLAQYLNLARRAISDILSRGKLPLLVGGTPLYMRGLLHGIFEGPAADWSLRRELHQVAGEGESGLRKLHSRLAEVDPSAARRLHPHDLKRVVRAIEVHARAGRPISEMQSQWSSPRTLAGAEIYVLTRPKPDLVARIDRRVTAMFRGGLVDEVRQLLGRPGGMSRSARAAVGYAEVIEHLESGTPLETAIERVKTRTWQVARKQLKWLRRFEGARWIDVRRDESPENLGKALYKLLQTCHNHAAVVL